MTVEEYKLKTVGEKYSLPIVLAKLLEFEEKCDGFEYAESFCLSTQEDDYTYIVNFEDESQELEYRKYIKKFSIVDASGGFCAFWLEEGVTDLENSPIVNYGSEGSIRIVASNIYEFLRILTFDSELMDGVCFKVKADYVQSKYKQEYLDWLKSELNFDPVKDLDEHQEHGESEEVVRFKMEAEKKYKDKFLAWHRQYEDIEDSFDM